MRIQWIDQKEIIEKTEVKNRQDAIMQSSDSIDLSNDISKLHSFKLNDN